MEFVTPPVDRVTDDFLHACCSLVSVALSIVSRQFVADSSQIFETVKSFVRDLLLQSTKHGILT